MGQAASRHRRPSASPASSPACGLSASPRQPEETMPSTLEEKDAIRELLAEYGFRLDDGHFAEMAALFAEGGSWDTAFGKATGRAAIADLARNLRERAGPQRSRGIHLVTNIAIAL